MTRSCGAGDVPAPVAIVVKGYPRLSETFIAQEILALEQAGLPLQIWSLRRPTDKALHPLHRAIRAPVHYLPEYLYEDPLRVLKGAIAASRMPGFWTVLRVFARDLRRDPTPGRVRRLGQAFVLAAELDPAIAHIHVHYLHTPASVVRYASLLTGRRFSFSAHAKDIWTTPDWDKREKIADSAWGVTCTQAGLEVLAALAPPDQPDRVGLVYHGLDLSRFPVPPLPSSREGTDQNDPFTMVTVGRMVAKKGFSDLLSALALLPPSLHWRLIHIGSGELTSRLHREADTLGLSNRIDWRGGQPQDQVIAALGEADLFVLPCREGDKGDRDGLPNVLLEAATQALPLLSTRFAGVPEFVRPDHNGVLVEPGDARALAAAIVALAGDPARRARLGAKAAHDVRTAFSFQSGVDLIAARLRASVPPDWAGRCRLPKEGP